MKEKRLICLGVGRTTLAVLLFGLNGFAFATEDIVKETYRVTIRGKLIYKDKCALDLGHMSLASKDKGEKKIADRPIDPRKAVAKEGYQECTYSRTWEEAGFTYETNTKFYPRKVVHTISYKFTKEWKGFLYINPWIDSSLVLGAAYKAIDADGLESEGVVQASLKKYTFIPHGYNLKELELQLVEGGLIRYKVENKNPLREKSAWAADSLFVDLMGEDGKLGRTGVRLDLQQKPPGRVFPAGYSNQIILEIEFE